MENVVFGVQLCIKSSIFNEKSDFCYSDHPGLGTSLLHWMGCPFFREAQKASLLHS